LYICCLLLCCIPSLYSQNLNITETVHNIYNIVYSVFCDYRTPPPIDISFGHAETLFPVYAALGLSNDSKPLLASDYKDNTHRKFHGSNIVPFSANLAIGLYKCDNSSEFVIKIFVNEETVEIPACGQTVCSYTDARKYYNNLVDCNFEKLCDINNIQSIFG